MYLIFVLKHVSSPNKTKHLFIIYHHLFLFDSLTEFMKDWVFQEQNNILQVRLSLTITQMRYSNQNRHYKSNKEANFKYTQEPTHTSNKDGKESSHGD